MVPQRSLNDPSKISQRSLKVPSEIPQRSLSILREKVRNYSLSFWLEEVLLLLKKQQLEVVSRQERYKKSQMIPSQNYLGSNSTTSILQNFLIYNIKNDGAEPLLSLSQKITEELSLSMVLHFCFYTAIDDRKEKYLQKHILLRALLTKTYLI